MSTSPETLERSPVETRPESSKQLESNADSAKLQEVEHVLQEIERQPSSVPVQDDQTGQVILTPTQGQQVGEIELPLTEAQIAKKEGLHAKAADAARWIWEWCARMTKMAAVKGVRVVYRGQGAEK